MKNVFKHIGLCLVCMVLVLGSALSLSACCGKPDNEDKMQVLDLSVNPGVEFIVDEDDKVVSVTARNEDGAYLLEKFTTFTGMTAKDAALKFLELSEQYGFVVEGSTDGENFTISVSGNGAEDLYNDVKGKIQSKANELGLTIGNMIEVTKTQLKEMVAECYQEYAQTDLENMTEEQLLEMLEQSRIETKDLHTEDERLAYYRERAQKVLEAKIDAIKEYVDESASAVESAIVTPLISVLDNIYAQIETAYATIHTQLETLNTTIKSELSGYVDKKEEYLAAVQEYRQALELNSDNDPSNDIENVAELKAEFELLKAEAKTLFNALEAKRENAKEQLMTFVETTMHNQMTLLNNQIDLILDKISLTTDAINAEIQAEITELKNQHAANSSNPWEE